MDPKIELGIYDNYLLLLILMQGTSFLADYLYPSNEKLQQFPWFFMMNKACWYP